jgi:hypothetical protein
MLAMRTFRLLISSILTLSALDSSGQIKTLYTPIEYCADTSKSILVSCYEIDSLRLEILYYKDLLEENKRDLFIANNIYKVDTVLMAQDTMSVNYYSKNNIVILKKTYAFTNSNKLSFFLNEDYYSAEGKITYSSRKIISDQVLLTDENNNVENIGPWNRLQSRYRYCYNAEATLIKVVTEFRIGGTGHRLYRYDNNQLAKDENFKLFRKEKINIWEFWD